MTHRRTSYELAAIATTSYDVPRSRGSEAVPVEQGDRGAGIELGGDQHVVPEAGHLELLPAGRRQEALQQVRLCLAEDGSGGVRVTIEYDVRSHRLDDRPGSEQVLESRAERPVGPALSSGDDRHRAQGLSSDPARDSRRVA